MKHIILTSLLLLSQLIAAAGNVTTDKEWYVTGEQMMLNIDLDDTTSRVVYIELSDTEGVKAGSLAVICNGKATARLIIPQALASGYYRLAVYTRSSSAICQNVAIINTLQSSSDDRIEWHEADMTKATSGSDNEPVTIAQKPSVVKSETIGHTIIAHLKQPTKDVKSLLSVVGKEVHIFGGQQINDTTLAFHTYGLNGKHQIVVSAYDHNSVPLDVEVASPYTGYKPESLPLLHFNYNRKEVEQRSIAMQQASLEQRDTVSPLPYSDDIFTAQPFVKYNLDEYRQFRTINDTFIEYVNYVQTGEKNGETELFVFSEAEGYNAWKALVLIDGVPTNDIKRLLRYDARRVHHINIYEDWLSLGTDNIYKGVVSFVTRTGDHTNFPPDKGSAYIIYEFPRK